MVRENLYSIRMTTTLRKETVLERVWPLDLLTETSFEKIGSLLEEVDNKLEMS
jgi:hypothetical protein